MKSAIPIKHACGHEVEHKVKPEDMPEKIQRLQQMRCEPCAQEARREKDRRRTEDVNRMYIATRLMAVMIGRVGNNEDYRVTAAAAVEMANALLAALRKTDVQS